MNSLKSTGRATPPILCADDAPAHIAQSGMIVAATHPLGSAQSSKLKLKKPTSKANSASPRRRSDHENLETATLELRERIAEYFAWGQQDFCSLASTNKNLAKQWHGQMLADNMAKVLGTVQQGRMQYEQILNVIDDAEGQALTVAERHAVLVQVPKALCDNLQVNACALFNIEDLFVKLLDKAADGFSKPQQYLIIEQIGQALESPHIQFPAQHIGVAFGAGQNLAMRPDFFTEQSSTLFDRYTGAVGELFSNLSPDDAKAIFGCQSQSAPSRSKQLSAKTLLLSKAVYLIEDDDDRWTYFQKLRAVPDDIAPKAKAEILCALCLRIPYLDARVRLEAFDGMLQAIEQLPSEYRPDVLGHAAENFACVDDDPQSQLGHFERLKAMAYALPRQEQAIPLEKLCRAIKISDAGQQSVMFDEFVSQVSTLPPAGQSHLIAALADLVAAKSDPVQRTNAYDGLFDAIKDLDAAFQAKPVAALFEQISRLPAELVQPSKVKEALDFVFPAIATEQINDKRFTSEERAEILTALIPSFIALQEGNERTVALDKAITAMTALPQSCREKPLLSLIFIYGSICEDDRFLQYSLLDSVLSIARDMPAQTRSTLFTHLISSVLNTIPKENQTAAVYKMLEAIKTLPAKNRERPLNTAKPWVVALCREYGGTALYDFFTQTGDAH